MATTNIIGVDLAKNVIQPSIVSTSGIELQNIELTRTKFAEFLAKQKPSLVAFEACATAHYWARYALAQGHRTKIIPAKAVTPFRQGHKTDKNDALAVAEAANRHNIKEAPDLAIDSKLRGCDLMNLKVKDISHGPTIQSRAIVIQKKTGKPVQFEITEETRKSLRDWIEKKRLASNDFIFPRRVAPNRPLTTRQFARIVDQWVTSVGLDVFDYGTHTMRRTKPTLIYRRTHDLRAAQLLLGHSKLDSTVRYLGVELDDALVLAEQTDV